MPLRWSKTLLINIIACGVLSTLGAVASGPGGFFAILGLYILGVAIAVIVSGKSEWIGIRNRNGGVGIIALSLLMIGGGGNALPNPSHDQSANTHPAIEEVIVTEQQGATEKAETAPTGSNDTDADKSEATVTENSQDDSQQVDDDADKPLTQAEDNEPKAVVPPPSATGAPKTTPDNASNPATTPAPKPAPTTAPKPTPTAAPPPPPPPPPAAGKSSYKNCTDVWNTIGRPILAGESGYSHKLDRDKDGVGCEKDPR